MNNYVETLKDKYNIYPSITLPYFPSPDAKVIGIVSKCNDHLSQIKKILNAFWKKFFSSDEITSTYITILYDDNGILGFISFQHKHSG